MPDPTDPPTSSAATATLPVDEQVDSLFDGLYDGRTSEDALGHLANVVAELPDEVRMLGLGRKLIRLRREQAKLEREERLFLGQIAEARDRLNVAMHVIENTFEALALEHREAKRGNSMEVTGVGVWTTRSQPARWAVDNELAMETMDADQRAEFTNLPQPKPPERKIKGPDFRQFLDREHLDAEGNVTGELPLGVERVESWTKVDYDLYD